jgi:uncharacterized protein
VRLLERADRILHGGDFVALSVLEELRAFAPVEGVLGNMDEAALRAEVPERLVVELDGVRVGMVHDAGPRVGRAERLKGAFPDCAAIVYGHTHEPEVSRVGGVWILNPGSPTERRRARSRGVIAARVEAGDIQPKLVAV